MTEHIKPLLQEFVDGELSPPEMQRVEKHVADCAGCRGELDDLKSISNAVASLGKKPLPVGFMQRLERRRKEAPAAEPARVLLSPTARLAAFAMSGAIVMLVAYDKIGSRFEASTAAITGASSDLRLDTPPASALKAESKKDKAEPLKPSLKLAKAPGAPLGEKLELSGGSGASQFASLARAKRSSGAAVRGAALDAAADQAPAAPAAPAAAAVSNEEIQAAIENEKRRTGMRILPRQEGQVTERELSQLAAMTGDRAVISAVRGAAPVAGPTPAILGAGAPGLGIVGRKSLSNRSAAPQPAEPLSAGASGLVLTSDEERAALWAQRGLGATPPKVDYVTKRLLVVVANDYRSVVEIAGVVEGPDRVLVTYRLAELPEGATRRTDAPSYQYRAVSKTGKPVQFQRLP